jgi:hypothetical protein
MEIASLLDTLATDGTLNRITTNPLAQFGTATRQYLGARYLPERTVTSNMFRETRISYRTVIANNGDRYSPAQKKNGKLIGHFDVILADNDIADDFTGVEYDALIQYITSLTGSEQQAVAAAQAQINRWVDAGINLPMVELNEKQRWEAMVGKKVTITGDNGYTEDINYPKFPELVRVGGDWTDNAINPFVLDIFPMVDAMAARGVTVREIVAGRRLLSVLGSNTTVQTRAGVVTVSTGGQIQSVAGRASLDQLNAAMGRDGLPPFTQYDLQYRTQTGSGFFLPRNAMVFIGTSDNEERIDLGDGQYRTVEGTLGYQAIGRGVGRPAPGRFILVEAKNDKPPRVQGQGWQTSLPVIQEPELIGVITIPSIPAQ